MKHSLILVSVILLFFPTFTYAISDSFTIRQLIGSDTTPPTTPSITAATPVAIDSIVVEWTASTDDFVLDGYQVFRDSVQIATTTLTTYTDTGLTEDTLYAYEVVAFDSFLNYSSSSASVSTTTLTTPVVSTSTPTTTASSYRFSRGRVELVDFLLTPGETDAELSWQTKGLSRYEIRWGRTSEYEMGYVSSSDYARNHSSYILNLEPGTTYYYELLGYNDNITPTVLRQASFETASVTNNPLPPNVTNLSATLSARGVELSWNNPEIVDFDRVVVLKSHYFFPQSQTDGFLVYQGEGETTLDPAPFTERPREYYTVFVVNKAGNVSSGAVVAVNQRATTGPNTPITPSLPLSDIVTALPTSTDSQSDPILTENDSFVLHEDILIQQGGDLSYFSDRKIEIDPTSPFSVSIARSAVPPQLKSIIFSVTEPNNEGKLSSFLLKLNQRGDAYETFVGAIHRAGDSQLALELFNFETGTVTVLKTNARFATPKHRSEVTEPIFPDKIIHFFSRFYLLPLVLSLVLLVFIFIFLAKRRSKNKDEDKKG